MLRNLLYTIDFKKAFTTLITIVGISILLLAFVTLSIILYKYYTTTELIHSAKDISSESVNLTSSIGSIISGTVGVMFSLCSVIFFILALIYQQNELKLQRKEIKESRKIVQIQAFDSTFFNLLNVQQNIRERIANIVKPNYYPSFSNTSTQIAYWDFGKLYDSFKLIANNDLGSYGMNFAAINIAAHSPNKESFAEYLWSNYHITEAELDKSTRLANYKIFFHSQQSVLGNYHRNLYHTLKYVYETEKIEEHNKMFDNEDAIGDIWINGKHIIDNEIYLKYRKYADFIQAQMSTDELALVFYNGLLFPKMKTLIIHYDLLENLPDDYLVEVRDADLYD
jgi:hypothetical protein